MSQIHRIDLSKEELQQAVNNLIEENKQLQMKLEKIEQIVNRPRIFADEYFAVAREIKEVLENG